MNRKEAIFELKMIMAQFEKMQGCEDQVEALSMAIDDMEEKEEHRRSWEEILAEERT